MRHLVRYAMTRSSFSSERDARRIPDVLPKRLAKYDMTLHPEKIPASRFPASDRRASRSLDNGDAFSLSGASNPLGFTHYCASPVRDTGSEAKEADFSVLFELGH